MQDLEETTQNWENKKQFSTWVNAAEYSSIYL